MISLSGGFVPDTADRRFLQGAEVSTGRSFRIGHTLCRDRLTVVADLCRGRSVLHVGFADHAEVVADKRARHLWLHGLVNEVATRCAGVDISAEAVESLTSQGIGDVWAGDVTALDDDHPLLCERWDIALLGEVLEHVGDPVQFLRSMVARFAGRMDRVVVTVPNAWGFTALRRVMRSTETVNTDHRFWFTPYTVAKVLTDAGLHVEVVVPVEYVPQEDLPRRPGPLIHAAVVRRFDLLRACCVAVAVVPRPPV